MFLTNLGTSTKLRDAYAEYKHLYEVPESYDIDECLYYCQCALDSVPLLSYALPCATVKLKGITMTHKHDIIRLEYSGDKDVWWTVNARDVKNLANNIYNGVLEILSQLEYRFELQYNIQILNSMMLMLANTYDVKYDVTFFCGSGIRNLTDDSISIGISEEVIGNLESMLYRGGIVPVLIVFSSYEQTFKNLPNVIECLRRRTWFTKSLGFYTRRNAKTIIRESYHNNYKNISNGIGYAETPEYFTLIRVNSVTAEELEVLKEQYKNKMCYNENTSPKSRDCFTANNEDELAMYKARLDKKGRSYKVVEIENEGKTIYKVIYNQYNICAFVYGPVNLQTYAKPHGVIDSQMFDY